MKNFLITRTLLLFVKESAVVNEKLFYLPFAIPLNVEWSFSKDRIMCVMGNERDLNIFTELVNIPISLHVEVIYDILLLILPSLFVLFYSPFRINIANSVYLPQFHI